MGLISFLKNCLYQLITRSGIVWYLAPLIRPIMVRFLSDSTKLSNHVTVDESGRKIHQCKVNGRMYPAFGVDKVENFSKITIRDDDVLLCGYPKTGCHWTFEILKMLISGKAELSKWGKAVEGMMDVLPHIVLDSLPSPRVLNTHYYYDELPQDIRTKKTKIIYTSRNPKDTVVSFFHHHKKLPMYDYQGTFDDFYKLFMSGQVEYGTYFDYTLHWDKYIKENPSEILLIHFEDTKANPVQVIKKLGQFLGKNISDEFAEEIAEASSFKRMKKERQSETVASAIFRKGDVGDWHNWLTDEQSAQIDRVWQERMTGCTYQPQY